jgi:hypothetical protein
VNTAFTVSDFYILPSGLVYRTRPDAASLHQQQQWQAPSSGSYRRKKIGWIQYPLKLHEYFHSMADTAF